MQEESSRNFNRSTTSFSNSSCILGVFEQRNANTPTIPEITYKNNYNMSWENLKWGTAKQHVLVTHNFQWCHHLYEQK
jgi:hypothetical protein